MMKPCLVDTDILSLFFRNHPKLDSRFDVYKDIKERVNKENTQLNKLDFHIKTFYLKALEVYVRFSGSNHPSVVNQYKSIEVICKNLINRLYKTDNNVDTIKFLLVSIFGLAKFHHQNSHLSKAQYFYTKLIVIVEV